MGVCRHPAMGVLNKQEVAKTLKFISGIGNNADRAARTEVPRSAKMFTPSFLNLRLFPKPRDRFPLTGHIKAEPLWTGGRVVGLRADRPFSGKPGVREGRDLARGFELSSGFGLNTGRDF